MASRTVSEIEAYLLSETHHGKPGLSAGKKRTLIKEIQPQAAHWIPILAASEVPGAREVAAALIGPIWRASSGYDATVFQLAEDPDWEVREWAVSPLVDRYLAEPEGAPALYVHWAESASHEVKRALAVAVKSLAVHRDLAVGPLLQIVDRLVGFENEYLRKNLGPFAIGDGLLVLHPDQVLPSLNAWSRRPEWAARWNTAAAFTAKKARSLVDEARGFLEPLADDRDVRVRRIAARALK